MPAHQTQICLAGKNAISCYGLDLLLDRVEKDRITVVTNKSDHGFDTWQPSLKLKAAQNGVKIINLDDCYAIENLIFLSLEFDRIVDPSRFTSNRLYNLHFSKLPAYKGMYTSALPLLDNAATSGVTLHEIDKGIDTGPILAQLEFPISQMENAYTLYEKYTLNGKQLLRREIDDILTGNTTCKMQPSEGSTYFSKESIDYKNLRLDLKNTADQIRNQIRAYTFPPYQVPRLHGFPVNNSSATTTPSTQPPGTLLSVNSSELRVATIDYDLEAQRDKTAELLVAAETGQTGLAEDCIRSGAQLDWRNDAGWTPLIVASYHGHLAVMKQLVKAGCDINLGNYKGTTPLMYAMSHYEKQNELGPFKFLLGMGADHSLSDSQGLTITDYAVARSVSKIPDLLHSANLRPSGRSTKIK